MPLPTYSWRRRPSCSAQMAMEKMLAKLSTRRYQSASSRWARRSRPRAARTSKSAVSRRFVAATETALAELMAADLTELDLVALMVDGVHFADHCCVVALGIDIDGTKHPLALVEGDTENATVVKRLLVGLRERGLDVTRPILFVLDGAKALATAVKAVFDHPVIARCQLHKIRNVERHLPKGVARGRRASDARRLPQPRPPRRPRRPRGAGQRARAPPPRRGGLACARVWPRPSPWPASVSRRRSPAPCARPTPSSR